MKVLVLPVELIPCQCISVHPGLLILMCVDLLLIICLMTFCFISQLYAALAPPIAVPIALLSLQIVLNCRSLSRCLGLLSLKLGATLQLHGPLILCITIILEPV